MQNEDQELNNLSPETVKKAIDAVKARAWDINPFTVADELKVSRSAIYRHADIMKLIITARGGSFGMDLQTSLDLTWQLRQLEQQNNELREKLGANKPEVLAKPEMVTNSTLTEIAEADKPEEGIVNYVNRSSGNNGLNKLAKLSWKDIETVYYFKVFSLKEYARGLSGTGEVDKSAGDGPNKDALSTQASVTYSSLNSLSTNQDASQTSFVSPFAQLKSSSLLSRPRRNELENVQPIISPSKPEEVLPDSKQISQPGKLAGDSESDLLSFASQLQSDLANKIRTNLEEDSRDNSAKNEERLPAEIKLIPLLKEAKPKGELIIGSAIEELTEFVQSQKDQPKNPDAPALGDALRDLIQSRIKSAAEQMAEFLPGHSIGNGKEFEVWLNNPARSKFVGSTKITEINNVVEEEVKGQSKQSPFKPRVVPPDVRKACLILGLRPDNITYEFVQEAWKKAIVAPGVHPDAGGDTELAVYLNTAKDVLMRFLDAQAPKLGKKFGPFRTEKDGKTKAEKPKGEQ